MSELESEVSRYAFTGRLKGVDNDKSWRSFAASDHENETRRDETSRD
jgi:hypothetical protein